MGLIQRIQKAIEVFRKPDDFVNRYEAANPFSSDRGFVPAFVRDARFDATSFTRWELARKIRYARRNCWLLQAIENEYKKWTVGPHGLLVIPETSNPDFNKYMLDSYLEWCESPALDSTGTMVQQHWLMAAEHSIESEVFIHFTRLKLNGLQSIPAIQQLESHRCSSPGQDYSYDDKNGIVDGVQLAVDSDTGQKTKPIGYWFRDSFDGDKWVFRSTDYVHHVCDPHRIGMYRDISPYHAVYDTIQDLMELEILEMQRAKQNSENAWFLTNPAGEIDRNQLRRASFGLNGTPPSPTNPNDEQLEKRINLYRKILGARGVALKTGETLEQQENKNPSAATQWYWRYKIGQVCASQGVPIILVFPELGEELGGAVVRGVYDSAHESFRKKSYLFGLAARKIYRFYTKWAVQNDVTLAKLAPKDPRDLLKCDVIPPRAVNCDVGYTSAATIAEYNAGITNLDTIAGRMGTTAEALIRKKGNDVKMIKEVAEELGVEPEEIAGNLADITQKLALAEAQENSGVNPDDDEEEPKRKQEAA